jgi:serine/threonine protein kinase
MNVLQKVHHPHCVQFFGAVTKQKPFMIITEFMGCGSMSDMFRGGETPSLRRAVQLALDCARGIAYLHNHNPLSIIHRFVCWRGGGGGEVAELRMSWVACALQSGCEQWLGGR